MHAFLIVGSDVIPSEVEKSLSGAKILNFPLAKISDVRELNNFTRLKVTEKTAIIIRDFDKAGEEAQNAFLKSLEETQKNLFYILTAININNILPTILSRCEVIETNSKSEVKSDDKKLIEIFIKSDVGRKLQIISKINKREEAMEFMKNLIILSHQNILNNLSNMIFLESALKTLNNLEANGNVQLHLTNFVLNSL